ncbi:MAG: transcriptional regulator [Methylococcales bacterium]
MITTSNQLPETGFSDFSGFLRIWHILGDPKAKPPISPMIPIGKSTWWAGVKSGRYPQPVKLGRMTMWRVEDIREFIKSVGGEQ